MAVLINRKSEDTAEAYLYGILGKDLDINVNELIVGLEEARRQGVTKVLFPVNSEGGEVVQGVTFYNWLDRTDLDITFIIDGIAASMMLNLISNPKHKVYAHKFAKFMIHRVQGFVHGNSDEIRAHADMVDTFEATLISILGERMKKSADEVKALYFSDGIDHWFSAQEAYDLGLVDKIITTTYVTEEADLSHFNTVREVFNFYNKQLVNKSNNKNQNGMNKNLYALALGLPSEEDENKIVTSIQNLVSEKHTLTAQLDAKEAVINELKQKLQVHEDAKIAGLINQAIADKKIGEDQRETYKALAEKDYAGVEAIIAKLPKVENVMNKLGGEGGNESAWDKRQREIDENAKK